jgi:hypothetical protein
MGYYDPIEEMKAETGKEVKKMAFSVEQFRDEWQFLDSIFVFSEGCFVVDEVPERLLGVEVLSVNVQPISANGFLYCLCYFSLAAA